VKKPIAAVNAAFRWKRLSGASSIASPRVRCEEAVVELAVLPSTWCSILFKVRARLKSGKRRIKMSLTAADSSGSGADQVLADVWQLASMVEAQLAEALRTLTDSDLEGADVVIQADLEVNRLRYLIEERVTAELAPGLDEDRLHLLIAVLYIIADLERIGDHAEGIAKVALMLGRPPMRSLPASVLQLGVLVRAMLSAGVRVLRDRDVEGARLLVGDDDAIDRLYDDIYGEMIATMTAEPDTVVPCTYQLWATHNLERIADRVTNLCERTVYLGTGQIGDLNVSTY
jgi:phosphate transport system protein